MRHTAVSPSCRSSWSALAHNRLTSAVLVGAGMGGLVGLAAGFQLESRFAPQKLGNGRLQLPGEWTSLITALAIFGTRYIKIVTGIVNPALAHADAFRGGMAVISAFFLTMLMTRMRMGQAALRELSARNGSSRADEPD